MPKPMKLLLLVWSVLFVTWAVLLALALSSALSASLPAGQALAQRAARPAHRHWVWAHDDCVVTETFVATGSTAGAPTPLPGLQVRCRYVPGHWVYGAAALRAEHSAP